MNLCQQQQKGKMIGEFKAHKNFQIGWHVLILFIEKAHYFLLIYFEE